MKSSHDCRILVKALHKRQKSVQLKNAAHFLLGWAFPEFPGQLFVSKYGSSVSHDGNTSLDFLEYKAGLWNIGLWTCGVCYNVAITDSVYIRPLSQRMDHKINYLSWSSYLYMKWNAFCGDNHGNKTHVGKQSSFTWRFVFTSLHLSPGAKMAHRACFDINYIFKSDC